MSRKHYKLALVLAISLLTTGATSAYATKVMLESKYSKANIIQQADFKQQITEVQR